MVCPHRLAAFDKDHNVSISWQIIIAYVVK